jgi:hypothetical protein
MLIAQSDAHHQDIYVPSRARSLSRANAAPNPLLQPEQSGQSLVVTVYIIDERNPATFRRERGAVRDKDGKLMLARAASETGY